MPPAKKAASEGPAESVEELVARKRELVAELAEVDTKLRQLHGANRDAAREQRAADRQK